MAKLANILDQCSRPPASAVPGLYDHDYFHGITSGYSTEGYPHDHPDFRAWLGIAREIVEPGVVLDLGSAYGYLLRDAAELGFQPFGLDLSPFALTRLPDQQGRLVQADAERLPLAPRSADVVFLLDVLEHLPRPWRAVGEAERVLSQDGLIIGATPDPILFGREEATHFSERPPSFWLRLLKDLGMAFQFRFSEPAYNFQFLACRPDSPASSRIERFHHDYIGAHPDIVQAENVRSVPRSGWGPLEEDYRSIREKAASLYLLNLESTPREISLEGEVRTSGRFATLRLRLDSLVLGELFLDTEKSEHRFHLDDVLLPSGGHHLWLEVDPEGPVVKVGHIRIEATPVEPARLTLTLPFDLYQRYRHCAEIIEVLSPARVLDVGGCIGDEGGHLAVPRDFLADQDRPIEVVSSDLRQCDDWSHVPADALGLPFHDEAFDLAFSLDVLEHIPAAQREAFLSELYRVASRWIVVGAPLATRETVNAERLLAERLMRDHMFLAEHQEFGLPTEALIQDFFREKGCDFLSFPNGYLPAWIESQILTQMLFRIPDIRVVHRFNQLRNTHCYPSELRGPCYRRICLIAKPAGRWSPEQQNRLQAITGRMEASESQKRVAEDPRFADMAAVVFDELDRRAGALRDAQFLANARLDLIDLMARERDALIYELKEKPLRDLALQRFKERRRKGR